ncbi:hypothetical protein A2625_08020 [candidate division WOR-1 bacterium RIFCSPHIGHO2_01_FULL_53_15]|uniref:Phospholipid/glycerol acyltransferase domain-containing protein n=1 Tax=candidate division WOR-1 bacterium RIFCSPHIGHO2_01_FULL_53_15 TaxID=1802564 RepID=A0A1F4Q0L0_UNCSA|nr:MAG: hypothetical protein A2625_08020 [candidate division WOR-1 bacterium RIFCSPHIGHO2_01_FULL_53_15]OGC12653.1 MAG: hypothetical protein A3D23_02800 [candidate division WOR-1 bacterium RIFCSPHIGHO2_02_FULL_53_26]
MPEGTSEYWRKLLAIDVPPEPDFLKQYRTFHRFFRPLFYAIVSIPLRFYCHEKVYGLESLPEKPPYIIAANHSSAMDYAAVAWALGKRREELYPLVTRYYYDKPWSNFWIKIAANAVKLDTVEDFLPALRVGVKILKLGGAIYVNPEGLRSPAGNLLPFRPGVGVLAVETGVPVVPVYLRNTWKVLPADAILPRPHPVSVSFGKPMDMKTYQEKLKIKPAYEVYKEATEEIRNRVLELAANLPLRR